MARARCTHNVVATVGKYQDPNTGEEKKRRSTIGVAFTHDDGSISLKLDTFPVTPEWSGWLNLYERDDNRPNQGRQSRPAPNQGNADSAPDEADEDIPF